MLELTHNTAPANSIPRAGIELVALALAAATTPRPWRDPRRVSERQRQDHASPRAAALRGRRGCGEGTPLGHVPGAVLSFEFPMLTAASSAEVRGATRDEMDLEAAVWTMRGKRMKAAQDPLSDRALAVLDEACRELPRSRQPRVPVGEGPLAGPSSEGSGGESAADRRSAARVPSQLSGLGRRMHRGAERGLRVRAWLTSTATALVCALPVRLPPGPRYSTVATRASSSSRIPTQSVLIVSHSDRTVSSKLSARVWLSSCSPNSLDDRDP